MKKTLTLLAAMLISTSIFAQKKPTAKHDAVVGSSDVAKKDKLVESFTLGNKKYNVYLSKTAIQPLSGKQDDVFELYKIVPAKRTFAELEIPKFTMRNGKITGEGFYKIENGKLMITTDSYDLIGAYRTTEIYITDKYGLKKISDKMTAINTDISDKYVQPAEMKQPFSSKN